MSGSVAKTIVATGVSSGLGLECIKQLLEQSQPYRIIMGARDIPRASAAFDRLQYDRSANNMVILPLNLSDFKGVKSFAQQTLKQLGRDKIDYLLLNAGMIKSANAPGPHGSKWCEAVVVNHFSQHYFIHLLRQKLVASKTRIVVVSSGAVRNVQDTSVLEEELKANSSVSPQVTYSQSKFVQLLGALRWREKLAGQCQVVAVSPGLIPNTGIARDVDYKLTMDMPDAKSVPEGAKSILAALFREDVPEHLKQIFLTSWGEWWDPKVFGNAHSRQLQKAWSPSKESMEAEAGITN